jgi:OmpA-OmpF porin, OOP family
MEKNMILFNFKTAPVRRMPVIGLTFFTLLTATVAAQSVKIEGLIKGRSGEKMIVQTAEAPNLIVILSDTTEVGQVQGMLQARKKEMSMAALIPGLQIKAEGTYNDQHQLMATKVSFKGNDLQRAQSIEAGMHETKELNKQQQEELEKQKAALQEHDAQIAANQAKIAENKAAVEAAIARFGQLDDYYIMDEVTVYFANGKIVVDPKYNPQLLALTEKAKKLNGYMIEVKGFASATGNAAANQKLSEDRAGNVTNILLQQGRIPLTRMLAPGAMGESEQVGDDARTTEGQAKNRRVVVRVLQNKAISGV